MTDAQLQSAADWLAVKVMGWKRNMAGQWGRKTPAGYCAPPYLDVKDWRPWGCWEQIGMVIEAMRQKYHMHVHIGPELVSALTYPGAKAREEGETWYVAPGFCRAAMESIARAMGWEESGE